MDPEKFDTFLVYLEASSTLSFQFDICHNRFTLNQQIPTKEREDFKRIKLN